MKIFFALEKYNFVEKNLKNIARLIKKFCTADVKQSKINGKSLKSLRTASSFDKYNFYERRAVRFITGARTADARMLPIFIIIPTKFSNNADMRKL